MTAPLVGVVLAAGLGTRLRPLTDVRPKALCPVADVPLIDLALRHVEPMVEDVAVNAHAHASQLAVYLDGRAHVSVEPTLLGTAGALGALRDWIGGRSVLLGNADAWHCFEVGRLAEGWDGGRPRLLVTAASGSGEADFGRWRYVGSALLPWSVVERLQPRPSGLGSEVFGPGWEAGTLDVVAAVPADGLFLDCGTPADYLAANLAANGGETVVGRGAVVDGVAERCVLWPGAVVGPGERLVECVRTGPDDGSLTVPASLPDALRERVVAGAVSPPDAGRRLRDGGRAE